MLERKSFATCVRIAQPTETGAKLRDRILPQKEELQRVITGRPAFSRKMVPAFVASREGAGGTISIWRISKAVLWLLPHFAGAPMASDLSNVRAVLLCRLRKVDAAIWADNRPPGAYGRTTQLSPSDFE